MTTLDPRALKDARAAYQSAFPDGPWHADGGETDAPIRAAIAAYLASPQPANPAQVTDASYDSVALEAARENMTLTRSGAFDDHLKAKIQVRITEAIAAAIGAGDEQPFHLVEEFDDVGAQMVVAPAIDAGGQAVAYVNASTLRHHVESGTSQTSAVLHREQGELYGERDVPLYTHPAPSGQAVATVDDVAARMWKADAEDSGTPASVAVGRTREAFDDQAEELKARWRKFAKAALSAIAHPVHPGWRLIERGEIVEADDEVIDDDAVSWVKVNRWAVGSPYHSAFKSIRRALPAAPQPKGE